MRGLMAHNIRNVGIYPISYGFEWWGELTVPFARFGGVQIDSRDFHEETFETEDEAYEDAADWLDKVELGLAILNDELPNQGGTRTWTVKRFLKAPDNTAVLVLRESGPDGTTEREVRLDSPELRI